MELRLRLLQLLFGVSLVLSMGGLCSLPDDAAYGRVCESDAECGSEYVCTLGKCGHPGDGTPLVDGGVRRDAGEGEGSPDAGSRDDDAGSEPVDAGAADAGEGEDPDGGDPDGEDPDAGELDGGNTDGGLDAGLPDAGPTVPQRCGTISALRDNFNDETMAWFWTKDVSSTNDGYIIEANNGILRASINTHRTGHARYRSVFLPNEDATVLARVHLASPDTHLQTELALEAENGARVALVCKGLNMRIDTRDALGNEESQSGGGCPFTSYWRLQSSASGSVFASTSSNRVEWSYQGSVTSPLEGRVRVVLGVYDYSTHSNPRVSTFDDLNVGLASEPFCPVSQLSDRFDSPVLEHLPFNEELWDVTIHDGCSASMVGGRAVFRCSSGAEQGAAVLSRSPYDLHDQRLTVRIPDVPTTSEGSGAFVKLRLPGEEDTVEIWESGNLITAYTRLGGAMGSYFELDKGAGRPAEWTIAFHDDEVCFSMTSTDGEEQELGCGPTAGLNLSSGFVELGLWSATAFPAAAEARFDAINP